MLSFISPFIESMTWIDDISEYYPFCDAIKHSKRIADAERIRLYFESEHRSYYREGFYRACASILATQPRLALYLPFEELRAAPLPFREVYMDAWSNCRHYLDTRECFNLGDIYEPECSDGEPELVKKAYHLLPWLIRYSYISGTKLMVIVDECLDSNDTYALRAIEDALPACKKYLNEASYSRLKEMIGDVEVPKPQLLKVTPKRKAWLEGIKKKHEPIELQCPAGPFSNNIGLITHMIINNPHENEALLIGGSTLKGYGTSASDVDIYHLDLSTGIIQEREDIVGRAAEPGDTGLAHLYMDTVWCACIGTKELQMRRARIIEPYLKASYHELRRKIEIRLEQDLLQFRLMHKGMTLAYPNDLSLETRAYKSIDGGSAFYDDRYREIATSLFSSYVWLPPLSEKK